MDAFWDRRAVTSVDAMCEHAQNAGNSSEFASLHQSVRKDMTMMMTILKVMKMMKMKKNNSMMMIMMSDGQYTTVTG